MTISLKILLHFEIVYLNIVICNMYLIITYLVKIINVQRTQNWVEMVLIVSLMFSNPSQITSSILRDGCSPA